MADIIFYPILGKPLFIWVGLAGMVILLTAGLLGYQVSKGKAKMSWHVNMARLAIIIGLLHGLAAILLVIK